MEYVGAILHSFPYQQVVAPAYANLKCLIELRLDYRPIGQREEGVYRLGLLYTITFGEEVRYTDSLEADYFNPEDKTTTVANLMVQLAHDVHALLLCDSCLKSL